MQATKQKIEFKGSNSTALAGLLELPATTPLAVALFSHCFTCGKDIAAASRIARSLVAKGYAVMRFDFTGLGGSDGDFANTNFSSNIQDILAAADYLRTNYQPPSILIGHSLGGTAVLHAALQIPECQGVVTIGSPADAEHVIKQFAVSLEKIQNEGVADINLAGRNFTIKKQFIDDLTSAGNQDLKNLNKDLLIFHSPIDHIVSIREAEKIYTRAKHPKSFISLGNADHLLSSKDDAEFVATTISAWSSRFISQADPSFDQTQKMNKGEIKVKEKDHVFTQMVSSDDHSWLADEPATMGGSNLGPDPYEHLLAALGTCTTMTIRMYANRKKLPLEDVQVMLSHSRDHGEDCRHCDDDHKQIDIIKRTVTLKGNLSDQERSRLLEIADRCPVHKTLHGKMVIETSAA